MPAFLSIAFLAGDSTPLSQSQSSLYSADGGHPDISGRWAARSAQSSVNSDIVGHVAQLDEFVQDSMTHVGAHRRYESIDARLLAGSQLAASGRMGSGASGASRGSLLDHFGLGGGILGGGGGGGAGSMMRSQSGLNHFYVPAADALNRWDIPWISITQGKKISAGGSGQIYRAEFDSQPVALKQLFSAMVSGACFCKRVKYFVTLFLSITLTLVFSFFVRIFLQFVIFPPSPFLVLSLPLRALLSSRS